MKAEQCLIVQATSLVNGFSQITLKAPEHAKQAAPGHFVIVENAIPCYLAGAHNDTLTLIIKTLPEKKSLGVSALRGEALPVPREGTFYLMQANDEACSAAIFYITKYRKHFQGLLLLGTTSHFPFKPCPSRLLIPGIPPDVIAALPLFEDWQVPHRLASLKEQPGCFYGTTETLAQKWLAAHSDIANTVNTLYIAPLDK
ncbi:MAG: hypothetical protein AB7I18_13455 [Candidatus Berkiella sp.]